MIPLPDDHAAAWSALRQRFPWPATRQPVGPVEWAMDYGGRDLIVDVLCNRPRRIVLGGVAPLLGRGPTTCRPDQFWTAGPSGSVTRLL